MSQLPRGAADAAPDNATTPHLAFITGSHAYGTPTLSSDVDLVIRCSRQTRCALTALLGPEDADEEYGEGVRQIKVGNLNLIMCSSDRIFDAWAEGTRALRKDAPVTRAAAVELFKALGVGDPDGDAA